MSRTRNKESSKYFKIDKKTCPKYVTFRFKYEKRTVKDTDEENVKRNLATTLLMMPEYLSGMEFCQYDNDGHKGFVSPRARYKAFVCYKRKTKQY
mmetsp:Transcript_41254/g.47529  ORF Transcript_41254/g.47529 Transcript_41254/m.47529 type:complete len:95 (-) Transcript_41254:615-899(-)